MHLKTKKTVFAIGIILFIGAGGFVAVNAMDKGKSAAEQSSFTREFIDENRKTEDGFFPFTSKIGQYKMLFPEDYQVSEAPAAYEIH